MSLLSSDSKLQLPSKEVQNESFLIDDAHSKVGKILSITDLPDDCLSLVYQSLKSDIEHSSFGLVCRHWLHIQNNNHESLWDADNFYKCSLRKPPKVSPESFFIILSKLLIRFHHLKRLSLSSLPKITDKGLEVIARNCASLEKVNLTDCRGITDSGISFIIQNCTKIRSLIVSYCSNVTGIGFLGCRKTLAKVDATHLCKLTTAGIKAIASGGGIKSLDLSGKAVNNEAVMSISKCCPLLKSLWLESCPNVQLAGWKAIGLYCENLKNLYALNCPNLCDQGLIALCYGCKKLSCLDVDGLSDFSLELFKRERPDVHLI